MSRDIKPLTSQTWHPHTVIEVMLDCLANPTKDRPTTMEWMLDCNLRGNVTYDVFCLNVKLLRDTGIIRAMGTGGNANAYTFESQIWKAHEEWHPQPEG